ncbi:MAG: hypothetical protein OZ929_19810 [Bryobacterales bacterium]|nr:hypothetical protein [Bryobacterales bacterium]
MSRQGRQRCNLSLGAGASLGKLAWTLDGKKLLVTCRDKGSPWFVLKEVDVMSGRHRTVASLGGSVETPVPLADGRSCSRPP